MTFFASNMAPPSVYGEPKIVQDQESGSVILETTVVGADAAKTKWFLNGKEIAETDTYKFSFKDEGGNRKTLRAEIKVLSTC